MQQDILSEWRRRTCVLATMHNKERVISPEVTRELGLEVIVPPNFNTDRFGTFTRDVERAGNQLEAARTKALAALKLTGLDLGLASEGSFGSHPSIPFISSNLEIVVLIDTKNNLEIIGHHRASGVQIHGQEVRTSDEAVEAARSWGFPEQGVILRQSKEGTRHMYKDLTTVDELHTKSRELLSKWYVKTVYIETDMRAHRCPARIDSIRSATIDLIANCKSICPKCNTPGFVITDVVSGLPCSGCGLATDLAKETIRSCQKCAYQENQRIESKSAADPGECQWCNP